jgi:hypothetical protein
MTASQPTGRAAVDWRAAGLKAAETRRRNLAARGAAIERRIRSRAAVDWRAAGLKAAETRRRNLAALWPALESLTPAALRQVRRMLDSMREFGFDSYWQSHNERYGLETGHTHRVAGDPIYHTLGQVAGVEATRAETIEALTAVVEHRRPNLPPRMVSLQTAIALVAVALVEGRRRVFVPDAGSVRIEGPILPPNWDGQEIVQ